MAAEGGQLAVGRMRKVLVSDGQASLRQAVHPRKNIDQGRLAAPGFAQHNHKLAFIDVQVQIPQHAAGAFAGRKILAQVPGPDQHSFSPPDVFQAAAVFFQNDARQGSHLLTELLFFFRVRLTVLPVGDGQRPKPLRHSLERNAEDILHGETAQLKSGPIPAGFHVTDIPDPAVRGGLLFEVLTALNAAVRQIRLADEVQRIVQLAALIPEPDGSRRAFQRMRQQIQHAGQRVVCILCGQQLLHNLQGYLRHAFSNGHMGFAPFPYSFRRHTGLLYRANRQATRKT